MRILENIWQFVLQVHLTFVKTSQKFFKNSAHKLFELSAILLKSFERVLFNSITHPQSKIFKKCKNTKSKIHFYSWNFINKSIWLFGWPTKNSKNHNLKNWKFCWFYCLCSFPTSVFYDRWMNTSKSQAFSDWLTPAPLYPPLHPTSVLCFLFLVHHSLSTNSYKRPTKIWKRINEVKKVLSKAEVYHLWLGKLLYLCAIFKLQSKNKPDAQRQEMVIGTLALLRGLFIVAFEISRASGPKGEEVL